MKNPFKAKQNSDNQERPKKITPQRTIRTDAKKEEKEITTNNSTDTTVKDGEKIEDNKKTEKDSYPIYEERYFNTINSIFAPKTVYKRLVDKKLTIILLENTTEVAKINDMLKKIIQSSVTSGLICIISYGDCVNKSEILSDFSDVDFSYNEYPSNKTCLFDALVELESLVSENYMNITEKEKERIKINNIEVIGIGTCKDNCSKAEKKEGIDCFNKVVIRPQVTTKYFCITEESFMNAAEIGFHSIGAIFRNYQ